MIIESSVDLILWWSAAQGAGRCGWGSWAFYWFFFCSSVILPESEEYLWLWKCIWYML